MKTDGKRSGNRIKTGIGCILMAVGFFLIFLARNVEGFADWYSEHIYSIWVNVTGRLMGYVPFSVSEVLLYIVLVVLIFQIARTVSMIVRKKDWKKKLKKDISNLWVFVCVLFFLYVVNCGINYHRMTFSEREQMEVTDYSVQELKEVCLWLTEEVNTYSGNVNRDAAGVMTLEGIDIAAESVASMKSLGEKYEGLSGYYPNPKGLLVPWILSVQNLTGVYSPFTIEANYNTGMTDYNIPFTVCHELSHLRGFMEEKEANFIGFLACRESDVTEFRYSSSLMGWI